jgi:hypothetical protein
VGGAELAGRASDRGCAAVVACRVLNSSRHATSLSTELVESVNSQSRSQDDVVTSEHTKRLPRHSAIHVSAL